MNDAPEPDEDETDRVLRELQQQIEALREQARVALAQALGLPPRDEG